MAGLVETDLDKVQSRLHDGGTIWPRAELLRYYNDGYRQLLAKSKCTRRFHMLDVPGRTAYAGVYEWEDRFSQKSFRRFSRVSEREGWFGSGQWEIEQLRGISPSNTNFGVTYLWERPYAGGSHDQHFRFYLGAHHDSIIRVAHDNDRLGGVSVKHLDLQDTQWWNEGGEPVVYTPGVGRDRTFEVFEVITTYNQPHEYGEYEKGGVRKLAGSRSYVPVSDKAHRNDYTYTTRGDAHALEHETAPPYFGLGNADLDGFGWRVTYEPTNLEDGFPINIWERQVIDGDSSFTTGEAQGTYWWEDEYTEEVTVIPLGGLRMATSPDRQYAPQAYNTGDMQNVGVVRSIKSSDDSISVLEVIQPPRPLVEDDAPSLIPRPMSKYLRYYALAKAFGTNTEGQRLDLSQHYMERFDRGVAFMMRLTAINYRDRVYQRQDIDTTVRGRPPRVRLPSAYPRVL